MVARCVMVGMTARTGGMRRIAIDVQNLSSHVEMDCAFPGTRDVMVRGIAPTILMNKAVHVVEESSPALTGHVFPLSMLVMDDLTVQTALMRKTVCALGISSGAGVEPVWQVEGGVMVAMIAETCLMRMGVAALLDNSPVVMDPVSSCLRNVTE